MKTPGICILALLILLGCTNTEKQGRASNDTTIEIPENTKGDLEEIVEHAYNLKFVWYNDMARSTRCCPTDNTIELFPDNTYTFLWSQDSLTYKGTYTYKDSIVTLSPIKQCPHNKLRLHKFTKEEGIENRAFVTHYGLYELDSRGFATGKYNYYLLIDTIAAVPLILK